MDHSPLSVALVTGRLISQSSLPGEAREEAVVECGAELGSTSPATGEEEGMRMGCVFGDAKTSAWLPKPAELLWTQDRF